MSPRFWFAAVALVVLLTAPALANDLNPPDYRPDPKSTRATWDFLMEMDPKAIPPDANVWRGDAAQALEQKFPNGVGYPAAATFGNVTYEPNLDGGYAGGADGGGGLVFVMPTWLEAEVGESTLLRLQVTYMGPEPPTAVVGYSGVPGETQSIRELIHRRVPAVDATQPPGSGYFYEDWEMIASPAWAQVIVFAPEETTLLQVIVDTGKLSIFENSFEPADVAPWK